MRRAAPWSLAVVAMMAASCSGTSMGRSSGAPEATIRSITFRGTFVPQQVVASGGEVWLVGAVGSTATNTCAVERMDPTTMRAATYPLPACGVYVTVGGGKIYLVAVRYATGTNTDAVHIERFDPATGGAVVMAPVVTAGPIGSGLAHMAFTYGGGSLWLYPWSSELWRISPASGAVVDTLSGVPEVGGGHPALAVEGAGIWLAGGPGGGSAISRITSGSRTPAQVYGAGAGGSILWLASANGRVWADAATYSNGGNTVRTRLVVLDPAGKMLKESGPEGLGTSLVAGAGALWSVGANQTCTGPQILWRVDSATARSSAYATLPSPMGNPCLTQSDAQLAVTSGFVFVLEATGSTTPGAVLYRVQP